MAGKWSFLRWSPPLWGLLGNKRCKNCANKWAKSYLPKSAGSSQSPPYGASNTKTSCAKRQSRQGLFKASTPKTFYYASNPKAPQSNAARTPNPRSKNKWSRTALSWYWIVEGVLWILRSISCYVMWRKGLFAMSWFHPVVDVSGDRSMWICTLKSFWKSF